MGLPLPPFDPNAQIPNNPFYAETEYSLTGPSGPLVIGEGLKVVDSTLTSPGGKDLGTVTCVGTGAGLTGGPITVSGTIALDLSGVTAGSYCFAALSVDTYGRVTDITDGTSATEAALGIVCLATPSEVIGGADCTKAITPAALTHKICDDTNLGCSINIASSLAVCRVNDIAICAISKNIVLKKGDIIAGTGAQAVKVLSTSVNDNGKALHVDYNTDTGLAWCDPPTNTAIPCDIFTARGQLITSCDPGKPHLVCTAGSNGLILTSNSGIPGGVEWCRNAAIPCACMTGKGSLISAIDGNTLCEIVRGTGTGGYVLTVDDNEPAGIRWKENAAIPCATLTCQGALITKNDQGVPTALSAGPKNYVLTSNPDADNCLGLCWVAGPAASIPCTCLCGTTKGTILVSDGTGICSFGPPPPTENGYILTADNTACAGVAWAPDAGGADIPLSIITNSGDIIVGFCADTPTSLPVGCDGYILTPDSTLCGRLKWACNPSVPCALLTGRGQIVVADCDIKPFALAPGNDGQVLKANSCCLCCGLYWGEDTLCSLLAQKGDLIYATEVNTPAALPIGNAQTGFFLEVNAQGIPAWSCSTAIPSDTFTNKGQILVADGNNCPVALAAADSCECVLKSNAACPGGMYWGTDEQGADIPCALLTGKGQIIVAGGEPLTPCNLSAGAGGQVLKACPDCDVGVYWGEDTLCCLLANPGDIIYAASACNPTALGIGGNCCVLKSNGSAPVWASEETGADIPLSVLADAGDIIYASNANTPAALKILNTEGCTLKSVGGFPAWSPSDIPFCSFTTKGDILVGTGPNCLYTLPVCGNGLVLKSNPNCCGGVEWASDGGSPDATATLRGVLYGSSGDADTDSVSLGRYALQSVAVGSTGNTAIGYCSQSACVAGCRNTSLGEYALQCVTTGCDNTSVGFDSLKNVTTGGNNSAFGVGALCSMRGALNNTAIGWHAMCATTTGDNNVAVGSCSLYSNTTGYSNTAVGSNTLAANTCGNFNVALGDSSLSRNITGCYNIAVGPWSLCLNTSGSANTAIGACALNKNTLGCQNNAFGSFALCANISGNFNLAVGECALQGNTTGNDNVALGDNALPRNTSMCKNLAIGTCALCFATADCNIAIGYLSGSSVTVGSNNIFLGGCGAGITTGNANLVLGNTANFPLPDCSCHILIGTNNTTYLCLNAACAIAIGDSDFGVANQVLQSNGPGLAPSWVTPGGVPDATPTSAGKVLGRTLNNTTAYGYYAGNVLNPANQDVVAIGPYVLCQAFQASNSVAIGSTTGCGATGNFIANVAIGSQVLVSSASLCYSVAVGYQAMFNAGSGANGNVAIGCGAGCLIQGSGNTFVGCNAGKNFTTDTGNIVITAGGETGDKAASTTTSTGEIVFETCAHQIRYDTNGTWHEASDERVKTNIEDFALGLNVTTALRPRKYDLTINGCETAIGFIAQEVDAVISPLDPSNHTRVVNKGNDDRWTLGQGALMPMVINSLRELSDKVDTLEAENADLRDRVSRLGG